ncbi:zinc dependent phospholipase C family protein [Lentibacillus saliphilus]|uniref:zinc dependent phospholipase C family protein n=1 Tax=Lentibacillus saliphilus TaxID=2737028 RepID=UPI001C30DAF8|nr:zinc dependent phospholipase C family protein [Lentibacillus saliphilus]
MPNIWTHTLFCEDVADMIDNPNPFIQYDSFMKLGAQGPDPFFYYNFWPWIKDEPIHEIGNQLHTEHCGDVLMHLIHHAKHMKPHVRAYVFGFVTHHILDRNTHPYIHYRAGYNGNDHQKLEVIIDTIMMDQFHKLKTWKAPVFKEIDVGRSLPDDIADLLHNTIKTYFPSTQQDNSAYIQKAYRDMKRALRLLADPIGWKNLLFKPLVSAFSHRPIKNNIDYLNMERRAWYHSATNEQRTESFVDLYQKSREEGIAILTEILMYWQANDDVSDERLRKLIANISYDTGKPLNLNLKNQYSSPIV